MDLYLYRRRDYGGIYMTEEVLEIVKLAVEGDSEAFASLCKIKSKDILFLSIKLMKHVQDGEDVAQNVMLYLQYNIQNLKEPRAFQVWLNRIVVTMCNQMRRKKKIDLNTVYVEPEELVIKEVRREFLPYEYVEDDDKRAILMRIIESLPTKCKECVLLFYYEDLSYAQIASILETTVKDIDNTLMKAKRLIRKGLSKKSGKREFLQEVYAIIPIPVLTQVLQRSAKEEITVSQLSKLEKVPTYLGQADKMGMVANTVIQGTMASVPETINTAASLTAAIIGGISVVTVSFSGTIWNNLSEVHLHKEKENQIETELLEEEKKEIESDEIISIELETTVVETEKILLEEMKTEIKTEILTLEDLLGEEDAAELRQYAGDGFTKEGYKKWKERQNLTEDILFTMESRGESYQLYYKEKESKLFMLIERQTLEGEVVGVAFRFTQKEEPLLRDAQVYTNYERWKSDDE